MFSGSRSSIKVGARQELWKGCCDISSSKFELPRATPTSSQDCASALFPPPPPFPSPPFPSPPLSALPLSIQPRRSTAQRTSSHNTRGRQPHQSAPNQNGSPQSQTHPVPPMPCYTSAPKAGRPYTITGKKKKKKNPPPKKSNDELQARVGK